MGLLHTASVGKTHHLSNCFVFYSSYITYLLLTWTQSINSAVVGPHRTILPFTVFIFAEMEIQYYKKTLERKHCIELLRW